MRKTLLIIALFAVLLSGTVNAQVTRLFESFESTTFPPTGWQRVSVAGSKQWVRVTAPLTPTFGTLNAKDGSAVAFMDYEAPTGEDWLISRKVTGIQAGDSISLWLIKQFSDGPYPYDSLIVRVSTTDSLQGSFTQVAGRICVHCLPVGSTEIIWRKFGFSLTQFAGQNIYIAFQHKDSDGHGLVMDSVAVYNNLTAIEPSNQNVPTVYKLHQNYPNPFNPVTKIAFDLPKAGFTTLKVYDVLGHEVASLVSSNLSAGSYAYDFNASKISSGVYYYRLESNGFVSVQKMSVVK